MWVVHGKLHRIDGPALIKASHSEYWVEGKQFSEEEFKRFKLHSDLQDSLKENTESTRKKMKI